MQRNFSMQKKMSTLQGFPARLDQELRKQFGDALAPHTFFDKELKYYRTDYAESTPEDSLLIDQFIAGFMAAVTMVTE